MNQKNFEYLRDQVKYTGFGEGLEDELKENMEKQNESFQLYHNAHYGNDTAVAALTFNKSKESDMYFFNSYKVSLQKDQSTEMLEQTFYINKGSNITLKEAYNLMEGRAVNKDLTSKVGEVYNAWLQVNFKESDENANFKLRHYHQNYGYDLEAALAKHPIAELKNEEYKKDLLDSLKKGNLQSVTFEKDGTQQKQYIEANPKFKTINIYDSQGQRLDTRQSKKEKQAEDATQSQKAGKKAKQAETAGDDGTEAPKAAKKRRTKQSLG